MRYELTGEGMSLKLLNSRLFVMCAGGWRIALHTPTPRCGA